jgi:membrane protein implicated in regulation of membrane protease activity
MQEFLQSLQGPGQIFWYIAIPSSIIFLIMVVLTFMGMDSTDGLEADFDGDSEGSQGAFQLFTLRNIISFLTVFSWSGIICLNNSMSLTSTILASIVLGLIMVLILSSLFYFISKLQIDYMSNSKDAIGKKGTVYLRIPENGIGKIIVSYGGANRVIDAKSNGIECPTGSRVIIISEESGLLVVESIS